MIGKRQTNRKQVYTDEWANALLHELPPDVKFHHPKPKKLKEGVEDDPIGLPNFDWRGPDVGGSHVTKGAEWAILPYEGAFNLFHMSSNTPVARSNKAEALKPVAQKFSLHQNIHDHAPDVWKEHIQNGGDGAHIYADYLEEQGHGAASQFLRERFGDKPAHETYLLNPPKEKEQPENFDDLLDDPEFPENKEKK